MECGSCKSRMKKDDPFRGCKKCSEYYCAACASTPDNASEKERNTSSFFDSASTSLLGGGAGSSEHKESESRNCSGHHGAFQFVCRPPHNSIMSIQLIPFILGFETNL